MNPLTLCTRGCVAEVSEEKFRSSMVIYEIYEAFPLRNFLRIRYNSDIIEVNPYIIQLFHRVQCIWLKGQIKAVVFIQRWHL